MLSFIKHLLKREKLNYPELMQRGAIIIDVRSTIEFEQGHVTKSVNIPLNEITNQIENLKAQNKPIITCCRSGKRSESAANIFRQSGVEVYNGGSWKQVEATLEF